MMNSQQIYSCLKCDKTTYKDFRGVFPRDMLINQGKILCGKNNSYVCNTAVKSESGEHWVAFFISDKGEGEYFDSFGLHPNPTFASFLNVNCNSWVRNNVSFQSPFTTVCGQYCVYFIHKRSSGESMKCIIKTLKQGNSDSIVNTFVNKHFSGTGKHALLDSRFVVHQIAKEMKNLL